MSIRVGLLGSAAVMVSSGALLLGCGKSGGAGSNQQPPPGPLGQAIGQPSGSSGGNPALPSDGSGNGASGTAQQWNAETTGTSEGGSGTTTSLASLPASLPANPPPPPECPGTTLLALLPPQSFTGSQTVTFAAPTSATARYFLTIDRVGPAKGKVRLNGQTILDHKDMKADVIRVEVQLLPSNTLSIDVNGNHSLVARVDGLVPDADLPAGTPTNHVFLTTLFHQTFNRGNSNATVAAATTEGLFTILAESQRVSSARVHWNGDELFGPSDFNPHVTALTGPILLAPVNQLNVSINGNPSSRLTLDVSGFMVDNDPPVIQVTSPLEGDCVGRGHPIAITFSDALSGVHHPDGIQVILENVDVTSSFTITPSSASAVISDLPALVLADGEKTLIVRVFDAACNLGEATVRFEFDGTPPEVTLTPPDGSTVFTSTPALIASYVDAGCGVDLASFRATLTSTAGTADITTLFAVAPDAAAATAAELADGVYTFAVTLADVVQNSATTSSTFEVKTTGDLTGTVVDPDGLPVAGARVRAETPSGPVEAPSDSVGRFLLERVLQGPRIIVADGYDVGLTRTTRVVDVLAGQVTDGGPWILSPPGPPSIITLDTQGRTTGSVGIANPALPGASVVIPAGTHVVLPAGFSAPSLNLSLHALPLVNLPTALPDGVLPDLVVSLQPEGIEAVEGFDLTLPASPGHSPGEVVPIYQFDPAADAFVVVAQGTVSSDGQTIHATVNSFFYPVFAGPGGGAGAVVRVAIVGQVLDGATGQGVDGLVVSSQGTSSLTFPSAPGTVHGLFAFNVLGRIGQTLDVRVTGTFPQAGTLSATVRTTVVPHPTDPTLGLTADSPLVITILAPLTVQGTVLIAGRPAACVDVEIVSGGAAQPRTMTNFRGEYVLPNVRVLRSGEAATLPSTPTGPVQDLVVRGKHAFGTTAQPELFVFSGTQTVLGFNLVPGTVVTVPPITLTGPGASPGSPGTPGTPGVPNDPRPNVTASVVASVSVPNGSDEQTGFLVHGLEYDCVADTFVFVNSAGNDTLWGFDRAGGIFGIAGNFGGAVQRDAVTLALACDGVSGLHRAFVVDGGTGNVWQMDLDPTGRVPIGFFLLATLGPLGGEAVSEADSFGNVFIGDRGLSGGNTRWFFLQPGQPPPAGPIATTTGRSDLDHLTREPGTERYFITTPISGGGGILEEVNPLNGALLGEPFPGDTRRLVWPAFDPLQDGNGGGRNYYGLTNPKTVTAAGTLVPGPNGRRVVAVKRTNSPNVSAGDPHVRGLATTIYEEQAAGWAIYGIAFGERTGDPSRQSLFLLESDVSATTVAPTAPQTVNVRVVELQFDSTQVFVGGTMGTPGTPPTPAVPDSNGDGLIDAIEILLYGALLGPDGDSLTPYEELLIYCSDPRLADTDGDGYLDHIEAAGSSDPTNSASVPATVIQLVGAPPEVKPLGGTTSFALSVTAGPGGFPHPFVPTLDLSIAGNATFSGGATSLPGVAQGGLVQVVGGNQGLATVTASGTNTLTGAPVSQVFTIVVRDTGFVIEAQCAVRNCPCTSCAGTADGNDGAFLNLSSMVGGFMWSCEVLPGTEGRNGLEPHWMLHANTRAHSRGGWFGTTPVTLACFERLRRDPVTGAIVYQEEEVREFRFDVPAPANGGLTTPSRYEVLRTLVGGDLEIRRADGTRLRFHPLNDSLIAGALRSVTNRFGDTLTCSYNALGQLQSFSDVYGRSWSFSYDPIGRLVEIREDAATLRGRFVTFSYADPTTALPDPANRLRQIITTPVLTDGGIGNQFTGASRKTYHLGYPAPAGSLRSDTNITGVVYPNQVLSGSLVPRIQNTYDPASDRVVAQVWGDPTGAAGLPAGGTLSFSYGASDVTVTDRNGNVTVYRFNASGLASEVEVRTRGVRAGQPFPDPAAFLTRYTYNQDQEILSWIAPLGGETRSVFDSANLDRFAHGNRLEERRIADARGKDGLGAPVADIVFSWRFEPIFQQVRVAISGRGNDPTFTPPIADRPDAAPLLDLNLDGDGNDPADGETVRVRRYSAAWTFDYQEGSSSEILALAAQEGIPLTALQAQTLSLGADVNGDGTRAQRVGNPVECRDPNVIMEDGTVQQIKTNWRHDRFGQLVAEIDAEGYLNTISYFPENDPSGSGTTLPNPPGRTLAPDTGGYVRQAVIDDATALRTPRIATSRTRITTSVQRDKVGNVVAQRDARGVVTTRVVNERNQVQVSVLAADTSQLNPEEPAPLVALGYETRTFWDANDNLRRTDVENVLPGETAPVSGNPFLTTDRDFDILDHSIEERDEVSAGETITIRGRPYAIGSVETVVRRMRFDPNENPILSLSPVATLPAGNPERQPNNVASALFDERDLPWKQTRGGVDPQWVTAFSSYAGIPASERAQVQTTAETSTTRSFVDQNGAPLARVDAEDNGSPNDGSGGLLETADPTAGGRRGDVDIHRRDGFGREVNHFDAMGYQSVSTCGCAGGETAYDPDGNVLGRSAIGTAGGNVRGGTGADVLLSSSQENHDELGRVFRKTERFFQTPGGPVLENYVSRYLYDRNSRGIRETDPLGHVEEAEHDGAGRVIRELDQPLFHPTRGTVRNERLYRYDDAGHRIQTQEIERSTDPAVPDQTFFSDVLYDAAGRVVLSVDNLGNAERVEFDSRNNAVVMTDANSSATTIVVLAAPGRNGTTTLTVNAPGNAVVTIPDGLDRPIRIDRELKPGHDGAQAGLDGTTENPDGLITTTQDWDPSSRCVAESDDADGAPPPGVPAVSTTTYAHDDLNRKRRTTFQDGTTLLDVFDRDDNLVLRTDQNGSQHSAPAATGYDDLGRQIRLTITPAAGLAGTTLQTCERDGLSRVTRSTCNNDPADLADDSEVVHTWDSISRSTAEVHTIGTGAGASVGRVDKVYDSDSRLVQITYPGQVGGTGRTVLTYGYDELDRCKLFEQGSGVVGPTGHIVPNTNPADDIARFTYVGRRRVLTREYGNGTRLALGYDADRRKTRITHTRAGLPLIDLSYAHDRMGRRLFERREDLAGQPGDAYSYDSEGRLSRERQGVSGTDLAVVQNNQAANPTPASGTLLRDLGFDGPGNWRRDLGTVRDADALNQYTRIQPPAGPTELPTYDANGNQTRLGSFRLVWNALDQLVRVEDFASGLVIARYAYDAEGHRVRRVVTNAGPLNTSVVYFHWGHRVIEEAGSPAQRQFLWEVCFPEPMCMIGGGGLRFFHENAQLSTQVLTDETGTVLERYDDTAWGGLTVTHLEAGPAPSSFEGNPYAWHALRLDPETGLFQAGHRYYDPRNGRFISREPLGMWVVPDTLGNGYSYAGNDPVNNTDRSGLWFPWVHMDQTKESHSHKGGINVTLPDDLVVCIARWNQMSDLHPEILVNHGMSTSADSKDADRQAYDNLAAKLIKDVETAASKGAHAYDQDFGEIAQIYGQLMHMVQDVNSHRGMTDYDHALHLPDTGGSTAFDKRKEWSQKGSDALVQRLAKANGKINWEPWCACKGPGPLGGPGSVYTRLIAANIGYYFVAGQIRSMYWAHRPGQPQAPKWRNPVQWQSAYGLMSDGAEGAAVPLWEVFR